ncbi:MAG: hypothetical protein ACUVRV_01515 [Cyanobacteriota bacterium]
MLRDKDKALRMEGPICLFLGVKQVAATLKNLEGKIQEAVDELTGDQREKLKARVKQAEAATWQAAEEAQEPIQDSRHDSRHG